MAKITFHNWYYKMIRQKTKKDYLAPHAGVAEADLEGLICTSGFKAVNVDELQNMNETRNGVVHDGPGTEHYFEF